MKQNPDNTLFILPYERALLPSEWEILQTEIDDFLKSWNSHGQAINTSVRLEESTFLIIEAEDGQASGCSKDKLFRFLKEKNIQHQFLESEAGKFFVEQNNKIVSMDRAGIKMALSEGTINPESKLFPTWISSAIEFENFWKKPLKNFPFLAGQKEIK
jgi:hypothetical protein